MFDLIFDHPQVLILVAGGAVFLFNKYQEFKQNQEADASGDWRDGDAQPTDFEDYERPQPSYSPPPMAWVPPPLPSGPPALPSTVSAVAAELERQQDLQVKLKKAREMRLTRPERAADAKARVAGKINTSAATSTVTLRSRLQNKSEIRRAIVLQEILGPPVGLR